MLLAALLSGATFGRLYKLKSMRCRVIHFLVNGLASTVVDDPSDPHPPTLIRELRPDSLASLELYTPTCIHEGGGRATRAGHARWPVREFAYGMHPELCHFCHAALYEASGRPLGRNKRQAQRQRGSAAASAAGAPAAGPSLLVRLTGMGRPRRRASSAAPVSS